MAQVQTMLSILCFEYLEDDGSTSFKVIERSVDLDYWNIRQWRNLYSLLEKEIKKTKKVVHLKIIPQFDKLV